ncbi:MAG TPA: hypothetical protein VGP82_21475, partial [Ktedonobacterales bacterium]|nr:hypothetical protein [Ktedonobacterales bacterium]
MPNPPDDQAEGHDDVASLSAEVVALLAKVTERFESEGNEEWRWIAEHSHNPLVVEILQDSTATALRVVDAIGRLEPVN